MGIKESFINIIARIKALKKGTKIFLVVLLAIGVFMTVIPLLVTTIINKETKTATYQLAVEHLMDTDEVRERYASDVQPELVGVNKSISSSSGSVIEYQFRFPSTGEKYTVYLKKEQGEWVVAKIQLTAIRS